MDYNLGNVCNSEGYVPLILSIIDVFNALESVNVYLDDLIVSDTAIGIPQGNLNLNLSVPGDGNQHSIIVESGLTGFCSETINFFVEDCNASCFLSNFNIIDTYGEIHEIAVLDSQFVPSNKIIKLGELVRFKWLRDGHSTTSYDTISTDKWDSGILDSGAVLELSLKFPGLKKYYSTSDDSTFFGNIIANCPLTNGNIVQLTFNNAAIKPNGFHISLDGVILNDSVYYYSIDGITTINYFLPGDGKSHQIGIVDIEDPTCTQNGIVKSINCQGVLDCATNIKAVIIERCNQDSMVNIAVSISALSPFQDSVYLILDDTIKLDTLQYINSATSTILQLPGDGLVHTISAIDLTDSLCNDQIQIKLDDCSAPCSIEDLEIGTGSNNTIVLALTNIDISLKNLIIASGDDVLWQWIQDSIIGIKSIDTLSQNSWDSGLLTNGSIYISPVLSVGDHPYYLYNSNGDILYEATISVVAACEENQIPVFYQFVDINGSSEGYDIYVDSIKISGPFSYALDGNNKGTFQLEGDDHVHSIEIRDLGNNDCYSSGLFNAPSCAIIPCGGMINFQFQDSCYNDNTIQYVVTIFHPDPTPQGFIFRINGEIYNQQTYEYDSTGNKIFNDFIIADSSLYTLTYMDLADSDCRDTLIYQSPLCQTDCHINHISTHLINDHYLIDNPETPDYLVGCQDSFVYVAISFYERYSDADGYRFKIDGMLTDTINNYKTDDGINTAIIKLKGDNDLHFIEVIDAIDSTCAFTTLINVPLCYSPCNITIQDIAVDSCTNQIAYYLIEMDTTSNSQHFNIYYDGDSINFSLDSVLRFNAFADRLIHNLLIVDNEEPLCRDSILFTAGYCLDCNIDIDVVQQDSCIIGDSIGYLLQFSNTIDSLIVTIETRDSVFEYIPIENELKYFTRIKGDSSLHTIYITSSEDQFCVDTVLLQTIDCTPIICDVDYMYSIDGLTATFDDLSTTSEPIIDQSWLINGIINIGNLSNFNFTFDSIGLYDICHTITSDSCTSTICKDILIGDPCALIKSKFSVVQNNDGFQFTNMSEGAIDEYLYQFGDGIFSNSINPFHIYQESGEYTACLIVRRTEFDCEDKYCQDINIEVGTDDFNNDLSIVIVPNPIPNMQADVYIKHNGAINHSDVEISICDISGQEISIINTESESNSIMSIKIEPTPSGIYFLRMIIDGQIITKKIVKL